MDKMNKMDKKIITYFGDENKENREKKIIFPDVFFRKFLQAIRNGISWPVNIEMLIENKVFPIIDKNIRSTYFQSKETHLSFINLYQENVASMQMEEVLFSLHKIFKTTPFKFIMQLENSEHRVQRLNQGVDIKELELTVRFQSWWRIIFTNQGYKNQYLFKIQDKNMRSRRNQEMKRLEHQKPWLKDLTSREHMKKKFNKRKPFNNFKSRGKETTKISSTSHKTLSNSKTPLSSSSSTLIPSSSFLLDFPNDEVIKESFFPFVECAVVITGSIFKR